MIKDGGGGERERKADKVIALTNKENIKREYLITNKRNKSLKRHL